VRRSVLFFIVVALSALVLGATNADAAYRGSLSSIAQVWTEPASGYGFLDSAITHAHRSLDLSLYALADPTIEDALIDRARAGVVVRVLLNSAYEGREENAAAAANLEAGSVKVAWAPEGTIFHAKYVVVDGAAAYVGTGNLVARDYPATRDFWIEDTQEPDVAAITATFNDDFAHHDVAPVGAGGLVWSPGSTTPLVGLINSATHSLLVENEEMDNSTIESALAAAAARGVTVKVIMTASSEWTAALARLSRAGVLVATLGPSQIYIHAKVICADCSATTGTVFIGSENFSTASLDYNRELGLITSSPAAVRAVEVALNGDFSHGRVGKNG
jgi:cardiolipin synthase